MQQVEAHGLELAPHYYAQLIRVRAAWQGGRLGWGGGRACLRGRVEQWRRRPGATRPWLERARSSLPAPTCPAPPPTAAGLLHPGALARGGAAAAGDAGPRRAAHRARLSRAHLVQRPPPPRGCAPPPLHPFATVPLCLRSCRPCSHGPPNPAPPKLQCNPRPRPRPLPPLPADRAQALFDEMLASGLEPSLPSWSALLNAYADSKQPLRAVEALQHMRRAGMTPSVQARAPAWCCWRLRVGACVLWCAMHGSGHACLGQVPRQARAVCRPSVPDVRAAAAGVRRAGQGLFAQRRLAARARGAGADAARWSGAQRNGARSPCGGLWRAAEGWG